MFLDLFYNVWYVNITCIKFTLSFQLSKIKQEYEMFKPCAIEIQLFPLCVHGTVAPRSHNTTFL